MKIVGETIDRYHGNPAVSASKLTAFAELGPAGYAARYVHHTRPTAERTEAMVFGQAFEDLVQGRELVGYAIKPHGVDGRTVAGKEWAKENAGRPVLHERDLHKMDAMKRALLANPRIAELVDGCEAQVTFRDEYPGLPGIQGRPDWYNAAGCPASGFAPYTVDLKSTSDLAGMLSGKEIISRRYHVQAAITMAAAGHLEMRSYLAVSCKETHAAVLVELSPAWLGAGWSRAERSIKELRSCYESGSWPLATIESVVLGEPPPWA